MLSQRVPEIDYLKCVFILLMVAFHLVYIGDSYPYAKQIVYTFHMPGFLLISGYLAQSMKDRKKGFHKVLWIFIPYACVETGYAVASYLLPVRQRMTELAPDVLLDTLLLHPIGPYWYLHTLMLCFVLYHLACQCIRTNIWARTVIFGLALFALHCCGIIHFANGLYFLAGSFLCWSGLNFKQFFQPSWIAIVPLVLLCLYPANLDRGCLGGVAITYFCFCLLLWSYRYVPSRIARLSGFIGRNTLPVLLFSPVFTLFSRWYLPLFSFDFTGICFLLVSVPLAVGGSIGIAWVMDSLHLSPYFFGKAKSIQS